MTTKAKVATTRLDDAEPRPARRQEPKARATVTLSRVKGLRTFQADLPHEVVCATIGKCGCVRNRDVQIQHSDSKQERVRRTPASLHVAVGRPVPVDQAVLQVKRVKDEIDAGRLRVIGL